MPAMALGGADQVWSISELKRDPFGGPSQSLLSDGKAFVVAGMDGARDQVVPVLCRKKGLPL